MPLLWERRVWLSAGFPVPRMMLDVLGSVAVRGRGTVIAGQALGGRRARVVLVALALADGPVPADRLARLVWGETPPSTWPVALRGLVRGLRAVCAPAGGGDQQLIATVPSGYQLAAGVQVDVAQAQQDVSRAAELLAEGRYQAVVELAQQIARQSGDHLLPGEDLRLDRSLPLPGRRDRAARGSPGGGGVQPPLRSPPGDRDGTARADGPPARGEPAPGAHRRPGPLRGPRAPSWPTSSAARCSATSSGSIPVPRPSRSTWRRCAVRPRRSLPPSPSRQPPLSGANRRAAAWRRRWPVPALSPSPARGCRKNPLGVPGREQPGGF